MIHLISCYFQLPSKWHGMHGVQYIVCGWRWKPNQSRRLNIHAGEEGLWQGTVLGGWSPGSGQKKESKLEKRTGNNYYRGLWSWAMAWRRGMAYWGIVKGTRSPPLLALAGSLWKTVLILVFPYRPTRSDAFSNFSPFFPDLCPDPVSPLLVGFQNQSRNRGADPSLRSVMSHTLRS